MSSPPNPLDSFRTFSYHHFLYASYNTESLRKLFSLEPGVRDVTGKVSSSRALQPLDSTFSDLAALYSTREKSFGLSGNTDIVLVINPLRDSDFTIESVSYTVLNQNDIINGAQLIKGELQLVIREAFGASFINYLKFLSDQVFESSWFGIAFALKTVIIGHTDDDQESYYAVKPKILQLANIDADYGEQGSAYTLSFYDMTMGMGVGDAHFGKINKSFPITATPSTLGKALEALERNLNEFSRAAQGHFRFKTPAGEEVSVGRPVRYQIWLDPSWRNLQLDDTHVGSDTLAAELNTGQALDKTCPVIAEEQRRQERQARNTASGAREAELKRVSEENAKKQARWKHYVSFMKPLAGKTATDDDPTNGLEGQRLVDAQCRWIEKWNRENPNDPVYGVPTRYTTADEERTKQQKAEAEAKASRVEEKKSVTIQTPPSVEIRTMIANILKRSSALKRDCSAALLDDFRAAEKALADAKASKAAKEVQDQAQARYDKISAELAKNPIKIYQIRTTITSDKESIVIHYDVIKKYLPHPGKRQQLVDLGGGATDPGLTTNGNSITFDYIFTGKNTDILQFDMKLNQAHVFLMNDQLVADRVANTTTPARGVDSAGNVRVENVQANGTTTNQVIVTNAKTGRQVKVIRRNDPILLPQELADEKIGYASFNQAAADAHKQYLQMFSRYCAMGALTASVQIRGNPYLLNACSTEIMPHDRNAYARLMDRRAELADRLFGTSKKISISELTAEERRALEELDMVNSPVFVKINVMMPADVSSSAVGTVSNLVESFSNQRFEPFWYTGNYWMHEIENVFDGEFKQTLKLMAYDIENVFNVETTIDKK